MKITKIKQIVNDVDAKVLEICLKVADQFSANLVDGHGDVIFIQRSGYVPDFMPGNKNGFYVALKIDIETGQILNWIPPTRDDLEVWVNDSNTED